MEAEAAEKARITKDIKKAGKWPVFVAARDQLKACGVSLMSAWWQARDYTLEGKWPEGIPQPKFTSKEIAQQQMAQCFPRRSDIPLPLKSSDFDGKARPTPNAIIAWVFDNMDVEDVKPTDAPSAGAWSLLVRLRRDVQLARDFYRTIWAKTVAPQYGKTDERFEDDGGSLSLAERLAEKRTNGARP